MAEKRVRTLKGSVTPASERPGLLSSPNTTSLVSVCCQAGRRERSPLKALMSAAQLNDLFFHFSRVNEAVSRQSASGGRKPCQPPSDLSAGSDPRSQHQEGLLLNQTRCCCSLASTRERRRRNRDKREDSRFQEEDGGTFPASERRGGGGEGGGSSSASLAAALTQRGSIKGKRRQNSSH